MKDSPEARNRRQREFQARRAGLIATQAARIAQLEAQLAQKPAKAAAMAEAAMSDEWHLTDGLGRACMAVDGALIASAVGVAVPEKLDHIPAAIVREIERLHTYAADLACAWRMVEELHEKIEPAAAAAEERLIEYRERVEAALHDFVPPVADPDDGELDADAYAAAYDAADMAHEVAFGPIDDLADWLGARGITGPESTYLDGYELAPDGAIYPKAWAPPPPPPPPKLARGPNVKAVLAALAGGEPKRWATLVAATGLSGKPLEKALKALVADGRVVEAGKSRWQLAAVR